MRALIVIVFALSALICNAESFMVRGKVVDEATTMPIEDASVSFKLYGKLYSTMTDSLGLYKFTLPNKSRFVIKVSHISYKPQSKLIILDDSHSIIADFSLESKDNTLNEVVVSANAARGMGLIPNTDPPGQAQRAFAGC